YAVRKDPLPIDGQRQKQLYIEPQGLTQIALVEQVFHVLSGRHPAKLSVHDSDALVSQLLLVQAFGCRESWRERERAIHVFAVAQRGYNHRLAKRWPRAHIDDV